jgi:hypothetical protein
MKLVHALFWSSQGYPILSVHSGRRFEPSDVRAQQIGKIARAYRHNSCFTRKETQNSFVLANKTIGGA